MESNPCTDTLTDVEYLEHMIPHHQVAVDMSKLLLSQSQNPKMLYIARTIIWQQNYEIWEMEMMKSKLPNSPFNGLNYTLGNKRTTLDIYNPLLSKSKDNECNPLFFKPDEHVKMMNMVKITDNSYLEHMIPHHQVAINRTKRVLLYTNNSYLQDFCHKLIINQQGEIYTMNNLLKNTYTYKSELLNSEH